MLSGDATRGFGDPVVFFATSFLSVFVVSTIVDFLQNKNNEKEVLKLLFIKTSNLICSNHLQIFKSSNIQIL